MEIDLISIIVPVYNCENYLDECIQSVLHQTYSNWELILINDGSKDKSLQICKKYSEVDPRVKYIDTPNQGVSKARNLGIEAAKGEFLMFIDSDDWIDNNTLALSLEKQRLTQCDVVLFSYYKSNEGKLVRDPYLKSNHQELTSTEKIRHRVVGFSSGKINNPVKTDAFNTPWAKLYKQAVVGDIRFIDRSLVGMEDVLFNIQVFNNAFTFSFLDEFLYYYRLDNPGSLTKTDTRSLNTKFEKLFDHIEHSSFFNSSFIENLNNRICCSLINLTLSLTHKNNRSSLCVEYRYLNSILKSERFRTCLKSFSLTGLSFHWKVFFFFSKFRLTFFLLVLSYLIRVIK
jgi:glycosyltransferase EpsH